MTEPKTTRAKRRVNKGATAMQSPTSPEGVDRWARDQQAVQLRRAGVQWDAIAKQLGYGSAGHAYNQVKAFMHEYPREAVEEYRDLLTDRLELVVRVLTPKVLQADNWSIDRYLKACEQLARLTGANRPERLEVSAAATELDSALRELVAEMNAKAEALGVPVPQE